MSNIEALVISTRFFFGLFQHFLLFWKCQAPSKRWVGPQLCAVLYVFSKPFRSWRDLKGEEVKAGYWQLWTNCFGLVGLIQEKENSDSKSPMHSCTRPSKALGVIGEEPSGVVPLRWLNVKSTFFKYLVKSSRCQMYCSAFLCTTSVMPGGDSYDWASQDLHKPHHGVTTPVQLLEAT